MAVIGRLKDAEAVAHGKAGPAVNGLSRGRGESAAVPARSMPSMPARTGATQSLPDPRADERASPATRAA
jgi:hypothetical protein